MSKLHISAAPHINSGASTSSIMRDVAIAMLPATIASIVLFGLSALWIILVCVGTAVLSEFLFNLCCNGVKSSFCSLNILAILPISVLIPTEVTIALALPFVTYVEENKQFFLSPRGISSSSI